MDVADGTTQEAPVDAGAGTPGVVDAKPDTITYADAQRIIAERDKVKAQLKELAPLVDAGRKALDASKTAEERLAALTQERDTLKTTADKATAAMQGRLAREIASIPEALRSLVPAGLDAADQLEWIGAAQAAGVFGQRHASPGAQLPGSGGGATITQAELANMPIGPKRQATMAAIREGKLAVVAA